MPQLLPSDIMSGLQRAIVTDPLEAARLRAAIAQTDQETRRSEYLLPGDVRQQGATLQQTQAGTENTQATTAHTRGLTSSEAFELGRKRGAYDLLVGRLRGRPGFDALQPSNTFEAPSEGGGGAPPPPSAQGMNPMQMLRRFMGGGQQPQGMQRVSPMSILRRQPQGAPQGPAPAMGPESAAPQTPQSTAEEAMLAKSLGAQDPLASYTAGQQGLTLQKLEEQINGDLNSKQWQDEIARIGTRQTSGSIAFNKFRAEHPGFGMLSESQQRVIESSFKPNQQPNAAVIGMTAPPSPLLDRAAKRIANRESTISEEINKGRFAGATAMMIHDDLVERVRGMDPNFGEAQSEAGKSFAANPATKRYVAAIDNARMTASRIMELSKKAGKTQSPALNKMLNKFAAQLGDVDAASVEIGKISGTEEFSAGFQRSGAGSETTRGWADELGNTIYQAPDQAKSTIHEILLAFDRSRKATMSQADGYISKPTYQFLPEGEEGGGGAYSEATLNLARKALADPNASAEHKAAAKKILGQ